MSKIIHPITLEVAYQVASNLRPDDYREVVEGHGHDPKIQIPLISQQGYCIHFRMPNDEVAGVAGITDEGAIWMLCTPVIEQYPHTFAREAKRFIDSRDEPILWNICDKRNKVHLKLLKFLGFKFLGEIVYGPNNLIFIVFAKCVNPFHSEWLLQRLAL